MVLKVFESFIVYTHCTYICFSMQVFEDAYKSPISCIVIDDIESLLGKCI